jgi:hypothetical protein
MKYAHSTTDQRGEAIMPWPEEMDRGTSASSSLRREKPDRPGLAFSRHANNVHMGGTRRNGNPDKG